jgi:capsular polysaccharide transport system permease protein
MARLADWAQGWLAPALLRRRTFGAAIIASLFASIYWGLIASDRYVSEAHIIIQRTELSGAQTMDITALVGNPDAGNRTDLLLLRDHLLSVDMMKKLDRKLDLRGHFSDKRRDVISRMWLHYNSIEWFHRHYLSRVKVEFDDYAGILVIKSQGYDPKMAQALCAMLVAEGEQFMNTIARSLAQEQVTYLEAQLTEITKRVTTARQAVLEYQNEKGLVSPQGTVENIASVVGRLEAQLAELQTKQTAMLGYLMPDSPNVVEINLQIAATEKQILKEKAKLASPAGKTLNRDLEVFQRLQMQAEFVQDVYKTALVALEKGRVESTRKLKKVSVLQSPTDPQYPLEPRRIYNTIIFVLITLLLAGITHLIAAIIRDHKE